MKAILDLITVRFLAGPQGHSRGSLGGARWCRGSLVLPDEVCFDPESQSAHPLTHVFRNVSRVLREQHESARSNVEDSNTHTRTASKAASTALGSRVGIGINGFDACVFPFKAATAAMTLGPLFDMLRVRSVGVWSLLLELTLRSDWICDHGRGWSTESVCTLLPLEVGLDVWVSLLEVEGFLREASSGLTALLRPIASIRALDPAMKLLGREADFGRVTGWGRACVGGRVDEVCDCKVGSWWSVNWRCLEGE